MRCEPLQRSECHTTDCEVSHAHPERSVPAGAAMAPGPGRAGARDRAAGAGAAGHRAAGGPVAAVDRADAGALEPRGRLRAAVALVAPEGPGATAGLRHLALDSVRCGPWEVFTLGLVWQGRVLPVGWAVLPYPWPKRQFTPTVCALVRQVAQAWPAATPAPHLVADRAFPSRRLFGTLQAVGWGWTI